MPTWVSIGKGSVFGVGLKESNYSKPWEDLYIVGGV